MGVMACCRPRAGSVWRRKRAWGGKRQDSSPAYRHLRNRAVPSTFCGVKLKLSTNNPVTGRVNIELNVPPGPPLLACCSARGPKRNDLSVHRGTAAPGTAAPGTGQRAAGSGHRAAGKSAFQSALAPPPKIRLCAIGAAAVVGLIWRAELSRISRTVSCGASQCGKWPQRSNQCSRASGKRASALCA